MTTFTRSTKPNGSTSWADNDLMTKEAMNGDVDPLYTGLNTTGLTDENIKTGAAIDPAKLNTPINANLVDDHASTDAEYQTVTDPGASSSLSAPTDLEGEIERLRLQIERLALGTSLGATLEHAQFQDGTGVADAYWGDAPHRPQNLAFNGHFAVQTSGADTAPDGWTAVNAPDTIDISPGSETNVVNVVDPLTAEAGIRQTYAALKPATLYMACVEAKAVSGDQANMVVTGADPASDFRDHEVSTASTSYVTMKSLFQTQSPIASVTVDLLADVATDDVTFRNYRLYELDTEPSHPGGDIALLVTSTDSADITPAATWITLDDGSGSDLTLTVTPPRDHCTVIVNASLAIEIETSGAGVDMMIAENGSRVGPTVGAESPTQTGGDLYLMLNATYVNLNPTPGTALAYTMEYITNDVNSRVGGATNGGGGARGHTLQVTMLVPR